jgi:hypothetical protein
MIGFRPKSIMAHLPFTVRDFSLFELDELCEVFSKYGFSVDTHRSENIQRTSVDGQVVNSIDISVQFVAVND